jgi:putative Holliday junction resolvase
MDRFLAIDYGTKRVGLALTDPLKMIAQPFMTLENNSLLFSEIKKIVQEKNVSRIILGFPLQLNGLVGQAAQTVEKFSTELKQTIPEVEIILVDERLTTAEAQKRMIETDARRSTRKQNIDQTAAALLLQNYLKTLE